MTFKDPQTNHGLKPCIQINFQIKEKNDKGSKQILSFPEFVREKFPKCKKGEIKYNVENFESIHTCFIPGEKIKKK